ncbi:MAG: IS66 family transposase [Shimia sp.]|nr:IS66 family transposase [Shimia sp.]
MSALQARVAELEAKPGDPPKTPDNSSLPPSSGQKSNRAMRSNKRRKGRKGTNRKLVENPDHVRDVFATTCPHCDAPASPVDQPDVHAYDHIDLPPIRPVTTRIRLHSGECSCCGGRIKAAAPGDMPLGSPFGGGIVAIVIYLHTKHMVSYERLREVLHGLFGLEISEGAIANMLMRSSDCFAGEAQRIEAEVRKSPVIASDETSARVMGQTCWQWVFASSTAVSHRIAASRAKAVVEDFLGKARPEIWVSDRYGGQMGHARLHQACLAHLLRDAQYAIDAGDRIFAPGFKFLLKRALAIARRRDRLKDVTLKAYQRDLGRRLAVLLARKPDTVAGRKLQNGMEKARDKLFVFVTRRNVPPTNNLSERLLRPSVIFRKVTNGFRSAWGAQVYADICSVIATGNLNGLTNLDAIRTCLAGRSVIAAL